MNFKQFSLFGFLLLMVLVACTNSEETELRKLKWFSHRDKSITLVNSFNDLFIDSSRMEQFIRKEQLDSSDAINMRSFYNSRNYQYAWFNKKCVSESGLVFGNLLNGFIHLTKDSFLFDKNLTELLLHFTEADSLLTTDKDKLDELEVAMTRQFFIYAKVAYGGSIDPMKLEWFIPRKKINPIALLDSMMKSSNKNPEDWEPLNPQYQALKKELIRLNDIEEKGGWNIIPFDKKIRWRVGDKSENIPLLKQRLFLSGDLPKQDSGLVFDSLLFVAVKQSQRRFGLNANGVVDTLLLHALNVPVSQRTEQLLINMERMRWMPTKLSPNRIIANIPEFKIHVIEHDSEVFEMPIVVGKEGSNTVIFYDRLKYIVFCPIWNVPASIVKDEILPAMEKNKNYLAKHQMEIFGKSGGVPEIIQKSGPKNSLGRVKFLFPNNFNIYFHDTPSKDLFSREKRAFSHGCMRLQDPEKLAQYLLRDQPEWTPEKIEDAMNANTEKWVVLTKSIPVYVSYFTAWIDANGLLHFSDDIYGHDKRTAEMLFVHPPVDTIQN